MAFLLRILNPEPGQELRVGDPLKIAIHLELDEPWFAVPELGHKLSHPIDGDLGVAKGLAFDAEHRRPVPALAAGRVEIHDTGQDDVAPKSRGNPPWPVSPSRAGRGYEVAIQTGAVEIRYGHLERGSGTPGARAKAGDTIGRAGRTGRCVDGAGRYFVGIEARRGSTPCDLRDLGVPIEVDAQAVDTLGTRHPLFKANDLPRIPAGDVVFRSLVLKEVRVDEPPFDPRENRIRVFVKRGSTVLGEKEVVVEVKR